MRTWTCLELFAFSARNPPHCWVQAAVLGALWYAASVSSLIKTRKVEVTEHLPTDLSIYVGRDNTSTKSEPQVENRDMNNSRDLPDSTSCPESRERG